VDHEVGRVGLDYARGGGGADDVGLGAAVSDLCVFVGSERGHA
jgi:hypothetical protein